MCGMQEKLPAYDITLSGGSVSGCFLSFSLWPIQETLVATLSCCTTPGDPHGPSIRTAFSGQPIEAEWGAAMSSAATGAFVSANLSQILLAKITLQTEAISHPSYSHLRNIGD